LRAGRIEEADALARLIGKEMKRSVYTSHLSGINYKTDVVQVWRVVRELTGKPQSSAAVPGITADILNRHYAAISTDSRRLSMTVHVQNVLNSCSQTLYALKTPHAHGLPTAALQNIYRSVVLAKVIDTASAWSGFASQTDRQRFNSFLRREKRIGFCPVDIQDFAGLCQSADSKLSNTNHLLHRLLPDKSEALLHYNLRPRPRDRQLPDCNFHLKLTRSNFFNRMLFYNVY
jgi:hypothetical protein